MPPSLAFYTCSSNATTAGTLNPFSSSGQADAANKLWANSHHIVHYLDRFEDDIYSDG